MAPAEPTPRVTLGIATYNRDTYLAAAILSGLAAYASARFLLRYFRSGRLDPYGIYCIGAGLVSLALLLFNL